MSHKVQSASRSQLCDAITMEASPQVHTTATGRPQRPGVGPRRPQSAIASLRLQIPAKLSLVPVHGKYGKVNPINSPLHDSQSPVSVHFGLPTQEDNESPFESLLDSPWRSRDLLPASAALPSDIAIALPIPVRCRAALCARPPAAQNAVRVAPRATPALPRAQLALPCALPCAVRERSHAARAPRPALPAPALRHLRAPCLSRLRATLPWPATALPARTALPCATTHTAAWPPSLQPALQPALHAAPRALPYLYELPALPTVAPLLRCRPPTAQHCHWCCCPVCAAAAACATAALPTLLVSTLPALRRRKAPCLRCCAAVCSLPALLVRCPCCLHWLHFHSAAAAAALALPPCCCRSSPCYCSYSPAGAATALAAAATALAAAATALAAATTALAAATTALAAAATALAAAATALAAACYCCMHCCCLALLLLLSAAAAAERAAAPSVPAAATRCRSNVLLPLLHALLLLPLLHALLLLPLLHALLLLLSAATYCSCCSLLLLLLAAAVAPCCCCYLLLLLSTATAAATPLAAPAVRLLLRAAAAATCCSCRSFLLLLLLAAATPCCCCSLLPLLLATAAAGGGAAGSAGSAAGAGGAGGATGSAGGAGPTTDRHCLSWPLSQQLQRLGVDSSTHCLSRTTPPLSSFASPSSSVEAAALGASESAAALGASESAATLGARASPATGPSSAEALHTFILDSGASRYFFHDCTTLTPLAAPVPVSLADPTGGPVVARAFTVLSCPALPSGSLSGLDLPTFSTNLVSNAAIQDVWVDTFIPEGQRVAICTCSRTGRHLATFTRRLGSSLYTLTTTSAQVAESGQVAASSQVSASGQLAESCSCRVLSHQTLLWHHHLGHPSLLRLRSMHSRILRAAPHSSEFPPTTAPPQTLHMDVWGPAPVGGTDQERYFLLAVDDYMRYTTVIPLRRKADDFPVLRLHSVRGGEFSSDLLAEFCRDEGIRQSFTLPASPQQNGFAERCIGLIMEVARTSMIHAATPHFPWLFAVRYAAHQLNLWPRPTAVDSGAETTGAEPGGAETEGEGSMGVATGGAGSGGAETRGADAGGAASPGGGGDSSPAGARATSRGGARDTVGGTGGAAGAGGTRAASGGGAGATG
ncbi:unnamed protein product [Closterium sp. NIES-54]